MVGCSSSNHDDDEQGGSTSSIEGGNFIKMYYMCVHLGYTFKMTSIVHLPFAT
jgi:hypothetical protein